MYINPFFRIVDFVLGSALHQVYKRRLSQPAVQPPGRATFLELFSFGAFVRGVSLSQRGAHGLPPFVVLLVPMAMIIYSFALPKPATLSAVFSDAASGCGWAKSALPSTSFISSPCRYIAKPSTAAHNISWTTCYVLAGVIFVVSHGA